MHTISRRKLVGLLSATVATAVASSVKASNPLSGPSEDATILRDPKGTTKVYAIQTGRVQVKKAQIVGRGHGLFRQLESISSDDWADWLPTYAWVIDHPEGIMVIDTGSAAHLKQLPRWHPYFNCAVRFDIEPEQEIGPQLRARGITPRDVKTVVLTHLHIDHDGGLAHFPTSRILADEGEIQRASGIRGEILGYLPQRWPSWFEPRAIEWRASRNAAFLGSAPLTRAGDVTAIRTPGHTPNHLSVLVNLGDTDVLLAGDASYLQQTMLAGSVDGVSPDEAQAADTLHRISSWCAKRPVVYLPTHDPQSASRLAEQSIVQRS